MKKLLVSLSILLASPYAMAAKTGHIGGLLGFAMPMGNDLVPSTFTYGIDASYKITNDIGVGAYFSYLSTAKDDLYFADVMPIGIEANYHMDSIFEGLYAGANLGMARVSVQKYSSYEEFLDEGFDISAGFQAGYDYFIMDSLSLGGKFAFIYILSDNGRTGADQMGNTMLMNLFLSARYWF